MWSEYAHEKARNNLAVSPMVLKHRKMTAIVLSLSNARQKLGGHDALTAF